MAGVDTRMVVLLRKKLEGLTDRTEAISIIRDWWELPENKGPREDKRTARESGREIWAFAASFDTPIFRGEGAYLPDVIEEAVTSVAAYDGLRDYARAELEQNRPVSLAIQKVLAGIGRPDKTGRAEGQAPARYSQDSQLAAIVWALKRATPFNKLTSTGEGNFNAYRVVDDALNPQGITLDAIRKAYRKHHEIFGGKN